MTKLHYVALPALLTTIFFASCDNAPKGDEAKVTEQQQPVAQPAGQSFAADTASSYIRFTGNGVGKNHPGRFKLSSGNIAVNGNAVTGGKFVVNINSLVLEQQDAMVQSKLRPHLLSADFFDAAKYDYAIFELTKVEPFNGNASKTDSANYNVSGNLTLKGTTRNITFPARIDVDGNTVKAKANFDIDRTQWGINYGNDRSLGNKFISEQVNTELMLVAQKQ